MSDIRTKPTTDAYRDGFDLLFGKKAACVAHGTEVEVSHGCELVQSETNKDDWTLVQHAESKA